MFISDKGLANQLTEACVRCYLVWPLEKPSACFTEPFSAWHFLINGHTWVCSLFLDVRACPELCVILLAFNWLLGCPQWLLSLMVLSVQGPELHSGAATASAKFDCELGMDRPQTQAHSRCSIKLNRLLKARLCLLLLEVDGSPAGRRGCSIGAGNRLFPSPAIHPHLLIPQALLDAFDVKHFPRSGILKWKNLVLPLTQVWWGKGGGDVDG